MGESSSKSDVTALLLDWSAGDQIALQRLMPLVYDRLCELAASNLRRERPDHTLQATALVHEVYLRLVDQHRVRWQDRAHFFGVAAQIMRRILVDHARRRFSEKRGGSVTRLALDESMAFAADPGVDVLALDELLDQLAAMDPRQARIVELRFFGGLSVEETAEVLGVSPATVKNDWRMAKAWLFTNLSRRTDP